MHRYDKTEAKIFPRYGFEPSLPFLSQGYNDPLFDSGLNIDVILLLLCNIRWLRFSVTLISYQKFPLEMMSRQEINYAERKNTKNNLFPNHILVVF